MNHALWPDDKEAIHQTAGGQFKIYEREQK